MLMHNVAELILNKLEIEFKPLKAGKELQFRCPFHNDRHASMSINADSGYYHCFSCGAGGKSIESFVGKVTGQKIELSNFVSEKEILNFTIENLYRKSVDIINSYENYIDFVNIFNAFMAGFQCATRRDIAFEYLKHRKLLTSTIKKFNLMFCNNGDYQNRVIVPYYNNGNPIGFNSRLLGADKKYLKEMRYRYFVDKNLFESYIYNFDNVKDFSHCILVEGPFDLMYMDQLGYKNVISTLSTRVSYKHLENLIKFKKIIFCFDNDVNNSGKNAVIKAATKIFRTMPDKELFSMELPKGKDPNDCNSDELKHAASTLKMITKKPRENSLGFFQKVVS